MFHFFFLKYNTHWVTNQDNYRLSREENKITQSIIILIYLLLTFFHFYRVEIMLLLFKKKKKRCKSHYFIPLGPHCHSLEILQVLQAHLASWPLHLLFFLLGMFFLWNSMTRSLTFFSSLLKCHPPRRLLDHTGWNNCFTLAFYSCVLLYSSSNVLQDLRSYYRVVGLLWVPSIVTETPRRQFVGSGSLPGGGDIWAVNWREGKG